MKKKGIIIIIVILGILVCAGAGVYIWYANSPFPTVARLMEAVEENDADAVIDCIEPDMAQKIQLLMNVTGISADGIVDKVRPYLYGEEPENGTGDKSVSTDRTVKFSGYSRDGDHACISVSVVDGTGEEKVKDINFTRISGTWYLTFG